MRTENEEASGPAGDVAWRLERLLAGFRREETHLSDVFIGKTDVYKLKKPIRLPFADYSTSERRKAACETEIAVNAALAADLYRGILPVSRSEAGVAIGDASAPIDWVVHMHPFPEEGRLDRLLARHEVSDNDLIDLTDRLYAAHRDTALASTDDWADQILQVTDDVCGALLAVAPLALHDTAKNCRDRVKEALEKLRPRLKRRGQTARLETCHGDLHLKNICRWRGRLIAYDALEFDPALTRIDALYEISFLLMDLWHHGERRAANLVMNRYLARTEAYEYAELLPPYMALRALIRAMAAASSHDLPSAEQYLSTAKDLIAPIPNPPLIAIGGRSGAGKSTVSGQLAPHLLPAPGAVILRSDVIRKVMAGLAPEDTLPADAYTDEAGIAVYARLIGIAETLEGHWPVILDATFVEVNERFAPLLARATARLWLDAPEHLLTERISARSGDASDATVDVMQRQRAAPPDASWTIVDAIGTPDEVAVRALAAAGIEPNQKS